MSTRTVLRDSIPEGSTPMIRFTIVDHESVGFKPETLRLTLFNYLDGTIINERLAQNVMDMNGVTVSSGGQVVWQLTKEDTPIINNDASGMIDGRPLPVPALIAKGLEAHIAMFEWEWVGGSLENSHEIEHRVQNMAKRPSVALAAPTLAGSGALDGVGTTV